MTEDEKMAERMKERENDDAMGERLVLALEKLADAQARLANAAEANSNILADLRPFIEMVPQHMRDMIERGFGSTIVK